MSKQEEPLSIQRILVALDASTHSLAALEASVDLAARFHAELTGIYVEDENLLRLAELPFIQEVGYFSATSRRFERGELERQIRSQSRRVQRVFMLTTQRARVTRSFRSVRGAVLSELLNAAADADLLVLGRLGWSLFRRKRLGSTVRGILPEPLGLALIVKENTRLAAPFAVLFDGSAAAERALIAAESLRQRLNGQAPLVVLLMTADPQQVQALQRQAAARLATQFRSHARYRTTRGNSVAALADIFLTEACGTVVMPAGSPALQNSLMTALLEHLDLPMLLVT